MDGGATWRIYLNYFGRKILMETLLKLDEKPAETLK